MLFRSYPLRCDTLTEAKRNRGNKQPVSYRNVPCPASCPPSGVYQTPILFSDICQSLSVPHPSINTRRACPYLNASLAVRLFLVAAWTHLDLLVEHLIIDESGLAQALIVSCLDQHIRLSYGWGGSVRSTARSAQDPDPDILPS